MREALQTDRAREYTGCKVKLCGLHRPEDVAAANAARPDFVGFVVNFPRSHRSVPASDVPALSGMVEAGIVRVGVFVDEPVDVVVRLFSQGAIDAAQLHGSEDDAYVSRLREAAPGLRVIQAFRVRTPDDVRAAEASAADLVLLDNGQGTGEAFDWSLLRGVRRSFILAGGLGPANVGEAVRAVRPWGVDMSSGIETDRAKDPRKMRDAVRAVREASSEAAAKAGRADKSKDKIVAGRVAPTDADEG